MSKKLIAISSVISLIFSLALLGFWVKYTLDAQTRVSEAEREYRESLENLAQALANMSWSIDEIDAYIDDMYDDGYFMSYDDVVWVKNRVRELRNP